MIKAKEFEKERGEDQEKECGESKDYGASLQGFAKVRVIHMERLQRGDKDEEIRVRCQSSPLG